MITRHYASYFWGRPPFVRARQVFGRLVGLTAPFNDAVREKDEVAERQCSFSS